MGERMAAMDSTLYRFSPAEKIAIEAEGIKTPGLFFQLKGDEVNSYVTFGTNQIGRRLEVAFRKKLPPTIQLEDTFIPLPPTKPSRFSPEPSIVDVPLTPIFVAPREIISVK